MRVVSLDVGSSSIRAVAYDEQGTPEPGDTQLVYDSFDADELVACCRSALEHVGDADVLAISCFWHSLLPLDDRERPLTPVLTWRDVADEPPPLDAAAYHRRTGCFLHPSFWPAKILHLRAQGIDARRFVSFGDYLFLKLTGELRSSPSTASGTGLYDPNALAWDAETLAALDLEPGRLPPVSDEPVAETYPALGDGACSNVGAGCTERSRAAVMIGTSAAARVVYASTQAEPRPGLFLYRLDEHRLCEGGALSDGGNLHAWLRRTLRDVDGPSIAAREPAVHGLVFLPFLGGERSLGWNANRRGLVGGLSFATTPLDLAQAALEAVCYRLADVLEALGAVDSFVATGGALLANPDWVQVLADVLGRPVELSSVAEGSARGAAAVALERRGFAVLPPPPGRIFEPRSGRYEIHLHAREVQRSTMRLEEAG